jgi:hypothetical protein
MSDENKEDQVFEEFKARQEKDAAIAAEQDAALAAVRAECDAYRAATKG